MLYDTSSFWALQLYEVSLNMFNCFQVEAQTQNSIANDQWGITPKINKAKLLFLCMTHRFKVLYVCMKFHSNSCKGFQLTEWKRNSIANDQRKITKINAKQS